jgi:DNA-binding response OmpR family regulator
MSDEPLFPPSRVLVVEAEPLLQQALLSLLRTEGYAPFGVASLEEALAAVDEATFAVILADLPAGKSRHSFTPAHILRRHTPSTPLGLLTPERVSPWDKRWDVFAFLLAQPPNPTRLLTEVAACLNRPLSAAQARQAEVVQRLVEVLVTSRWRTLRSLCTPDVRYTPPTALLGVPAPWLEGQRALTAYTSSV